MEGLAIIRLLKEWKGKVKSQEENGRWRSSCKKKMIGNALGKHSSFPLPSPFSHSIRKSSVHPSPSFCFSPKGARNVRQCTLLPLLTHPVGEFSAGLSARAWIQGIFPKSSIISFSPFLLQSYRRTTTSVLSSFNQSALHSRSPCSYLNCRR